MPSSISKELPLLPPNLRQPTPAALPIFAVHPKVAFRRLLEPIGLLNQYHEAFMSAAIDAKVLFIVTSRHSFTKPWRIRLLVMSCLRFLKGSAVNPSICSVYVAKECAHNLPPPSQWQQ